MSRIWKRRFLLVIVALCSLVVVTDVDAGIIGRGNSRRPGVLDCRSNNRNRPTTTETATTSMAATGGAAASGQTATTGNDATLSVRGQSPDDTNTRTGSSVNANPRGAVNNFNQPALPSPGATSAPNRPQ